VYVNGHNLLAAKLRTADIGYRMLDNAFLHIDDWEAAQKLADESDSRLLHEKLDHYARLFCPPIESLGVAYQWNLAQVEYATDIVFRRRQDLAPIYDSLVRTAVHSVKAAHVATFLGRRLHRNNSEEIGNDFNTRIQGTRIKHCMGPTSIKAYDKAGIILRIETTTNNPKWFTHYRTVAHRDGTRSHELAPLKKSIYSLHDLRQLAVAANRRYLEFLSSLEDLASPSRPSDASPTRSSRQAARTAASTSSRTKTSDSSRSSFAANTPSKACATRTYANTCSTNPPPRSRACSGACAATASSRRSAAPTSTTSRRRDAP
jgi:hypothetical protein